MTVREIIKRLNKVDDLGTEVYVSINNSDGIEVETVTDEGHGVFLEVTVREMFELIENLCNKYGIDEVEKTINSIFQSLKG